MKFLGIDYGKRKIGLAISTEGKLATPYKVLRITSVDDAVLQVKDVLVDEKVDRVVIGISEGNMAGETRDFAKSLAHKTGVKISYQDETLTTKDAQELSFRAGIKRKKRRSMEDAFSATLILQNFLDEGKVFE